MAYARAGPPPSECRSERSYSARVLAVRTRALRRTYVTRKGLFGQTVVNREALKGLDLEVEDGELFGLLGPNGAGKTTLVKILATVLLPTSGEVSVLGHDVVRAADAVRRQIGLVFGGERGLYTGVSGRDTLLFWAAMYRVPEAEARRRVAELLERVGLGARADERAETYSRGMKQRLHLARGLIARPRLLLLDEPTIGLDPVAAREIRKLIQELNAGGTTVFLTTHYMAEAEALCARVAFISGGTIALVDRPRVLTRLATEISVVDADVPTTGIEGLSREVAALGGTAAHRASVIDGLSTVTITGEVDHARLLVLLSAAGAQRVNTREPTLEDVYVKLLGAQGTTT